MDIIEHRLMEAKSAISEILPSTFDGTRTWAKGEYFFLFCKPTKRIRNILDIDKEILVVGNIYRDQQFRTIDFAKRIIEESAGRVEGRLFFVIHEDPKGNAKLKKWGREQGLTVIPLFRSESGFPDGQELLQYFAHDFFSQDPFDVTTPVSDDAQFYGRRQEAQELARRLQKGQIRSYLGIRKIGKTSILNRTISEIDRGFDAVTILIDCQRNSIFKLSSAQLMNSIALSINSCIENGQSRADVTPDLATISLEQATAKFQAALIDAAKPVILAFDEVDYITPAQTTPEAARWKEDFIEFWRNMRAAYQSAQRDEVVLSILVCGVSSKWFSRGEIDGVENAALAFVPEEYLGPLPGGAAAAMVKNLGKQAGMIFDEAVAEQLARVCGYMPFWIRKLGSYMHHRLDTSSRPMRIAPTDVELLSKKFIAEEGGQIAKIALDHLFRVYPELRADAISQAQSEPARLPMASSRILQRYGILDAENKLSGAMISAALKELADEEPVTSSFTMKAVEPSGVDFANDGDWSEALAEVAKRRNLTEKKLREVAINYLRFASLNRQISSPARDVVLSAVDKKRREALSKYELEAIVPQLYWRDLKNIVSRNWESFQGIFGDKKRTEAVFDLLNDRPDAHAKPFDVADFALYRRELKWLEEKLTSFG